MYVAAKDPNFLFEIAENDNNNNNNNNNHNHNNNNNNKNNITFIHKYTYNWITYCLQS